MQNADGDAFKQVGAKSKAVAAKAGTEEKAKLQPLEVAMQLLGHAQLLWFVFSGSLGYVELQLIFAAEVIIINVLSIPLYRSRGVAKHVSSMAMTLFGLSVMLMLLIGGYAANLDAQHENMSVFAQLNWHDFLIGIAYMLIRFVGILVVALASGDPKLSWARSSLTTGGVAFITMFFMAFIGFMGGILMTNAVAMAGGHMNVSVVLSVVAIALHFGFTILIDTMPQKEMREMADNPYAKADNA
jgi:hypothetical protein